jgi:hypothetical protein
MISKFVALSCLSQVTSVLMCNETEAQARSVGYCMHSKKREREIEIEYHFRFRVTVLSWC